WTPSGNPVPNDLGGDGNDWKFAATPEPDNSNPVFQGQNALVRSRRAELCGVRGAAVADPVTSPLAGSCEPPSIHTAWQVTTGRPDVAIAVLAPQDLIIAFSDGTDADHNGFVDDIAGWDFLDNDNDPYDDVQYGHGTGEASDSSSEANNGGQSGACPNCMVVPLRVGDTFV